MPKAKTLVAIFGSVAAASVATDWPPLGPVVLPSVHAPLDRCAQPRNLREAHDVLAQILDPSLIDQIRAGSEQDSMAFNSTIGAALRNQWGLWNSSPLRDYFRALGVLHPDDMSELLFVTFWRHLHDQPLRVEEIVTRLQAANAAGAWKPDPRCRCLAYGACTRVEVTDRRLATDRAFDVYGCCCWEIPQIVEGRPFPLPPPWRVMVVPAGMFFRQMACGAEYQ